MAHPAAPRWPYVHLGRGHYESYYLRAVDPAQPRGVWIRYTVTRPPGQPPAGHLWCTFFDRTRDLVRAVRVPAGEPATGPGEWIRLGESMFRTGEAVGGLQSGQSSARWTLRWSPGAEPLRHLRPNLLYSAPFPRTKLVSLTPATTFDGLLEVDGEEVPVEGWLGMTGHNWGEQHAQRWVWLHGVGFEGAGPDTWLDVAIAQVRVGSATTPWIANGALSLEGHRLRLGGPGRRVRVVRTPTGGELRLPGPGVRVSVSVSAPSSAFAEWDYPNPDGHVHRVVNCSVADLSLRVTRRRRPPVALVAPGRGAYEFGQAGS